MSDYEEMIAAGLLEKQFMRNLPFMRGLPYDTFESVEAIFSKAEGKAAVQKLRKDFKHNSFGVAELIKEAFNANGIISKVITFKNGKASDRGINVSGHISTWHTVVLTGEWVIDILHSDELIKTKDYIAELQRHNPKLRIDYKMSTDWHTEDGFLYRPSLDDLITYKGFGERVGYRLFL